MADLILDSGALIACERNDRRFWVAFRRVEAQGRALVLPAPVFAQVWRHPTQAIIARLVKACEVVPMDLALARDVDGDQGRRAPYSVRLLTPVPAISPRGQGIDWSSTVANGRKEAR